MPSITPKLPDTGTTIFTLMSSLAVEYKAINLGQGFPDFPMNADLIESVYAAMKDGHNQYTHTNGFLALRETIAEKINYLYQADINPDTEITITPGGSYAIYTALSAILQPGDEVIIFQPGYDSYIPNVVANHAVPVLVALDYPEYSINWTAVKKAITPRTKVIMLNSPHNPTGTVLHEKDIDELRALVQGTGIFIVSDEVYEHVIFDGKTHHSILRYPDLYARSFVCFSFGKIYHCTGWKIGYCVAPARAMHEFRKIHQYSAFSTDTPKQVALSLFLKKRDHYESLGRQIQERRDYFLELMKQTQFNMFASSGSYFVLAGYGHFSTEPENDFVIRITQKYGVACIPLSAFYKDGTDNKVVRFCFAKTNETLENAAERLSKI